MRRESASDSDDSTRSPYSLSSRKVDARRHVVPRSLYLARSIQLHPFIDLYLDRFKDIHIHELISFGWQIIPILKGVDSVSSGFLRVVRVGSSWLGNERTPHSRWRSYGNRIFPLSSTWLAYKRVQCWGR